MCTVTYIPLEGGNYLLTSNRDEAPARSPQNITRQRIAGQELAFPRDEAAGGTWIAISSANRLACILNGAFEKHDRNPPYRRSRGLMALDFFEYPSAEEFLKHYTFEGMEPFTMLVLERGRLLELRWDEQRTHILWPDPRELHIWSSSPLYPKEVRYKREQWFAEWREGKRHFSREDALDFHCNAGEGDPWNDVVMNRGGIVRTVSITSIVKEDTFIDMQYHDLLNGQMKQTKIGLQGEVVGSR
ncbi:MAG: NRDE family protein [Phaeodactylibacter sp.]|nr:NRDE family protein [Phaeodactylibacter sp.]MCB9053398.1 NRDE family protein [Lewinellaceae bacterium]